MKKKKKILIFQTGEPTHLDRSAAPMRLINLVDKLLQYNYEIIVLTSRFHHQEKKFRNKKLLIKNKEINLKYVFIESPGYEKNVSIKRFYDHLVLAKNLRKAISNINEIDYVFMGYPPIEACFVLSYWCVKKKISYIVDYKDLWPELFVHEKNLLTRIIFFPLIFFLKFLRNYTLKNSSAISVISNQFLDDLNLDNVQKKKIVCYLTKKKLSNLNLERIGENIRIKFPSKKIKIVFIGNFMTDAFNFKVILQIKEFIQVSENLEFYFFGDGPSKIEIMKTLNFGNIYIGDRVNADEFQYIMENSQGVFLPINNRFDYLKSVPNKVVDAIQYKLPIFTCLQGETKSFIEKYKIGFIYKNDFDLLNNLKWFCDNSNYNLIKKNYENSELEKIFNHELNYKKIIDKINFDLGHNGE